MARTDRPGEIGGGTRGTQAARGRVGSSTYGRNAGKPKKVTKSSVKTAKAKEDLPYQRVQRALEGKEAKNWDPVKIAREARLQKAVDKTLKNKMVTERAEVNNGKITRPEYATYNRKLRAISGKAKDIKENAKVAKQLDRGFSQRGAVKKVAQIKEETKRVSKPSKLLKVPVKKKGK